MSTITITRTTGLRRVFQNIRAAIAKVILRVVVRKVPVEIRHPDGSTIAPAGGRDLPVIELVKPDDFFIRLAEHPKIGVGEAYMAGEWRTGPNTDLAEALYPFAANIKTAVPPILNKLRRIVDRPIPGTQRNSLIGSKRNIEAHYDLSNDLFEAFLDPTMSYSSAIFDAEQPFADQDLKTAQLRKIHSILDLANVTAGTSVLEIGTGWGALAIEAARRGAHVTTVTLSNEQAQLAQERGDAAGLSDQIDIRIQDYREVTGTFDSVVSVEMIEAVGEEYWPTYFEALDRLTALGGTIAIQAITMSHDRYLATRHSYGWIQKHIFPGGLIPSMEAIFKTTEEHCEIRVDRMFAFGKHYAETLRRWRTQFNNSWSAISTHGFDELFRRKWEFYLAYCEAGFDSGYLDVVQIRLTRPNEEVHA